MPQAGSQAIAENAPVTSPPRRFHSVEKKRRVVEETLQPNASVARIARAHGVNANQVFFWRKLYQRGLLELTPSQAELLPVQILDAEAIQPVKARVTDSETLAPPRPAPAASCSGTIHIELAQAKLRVEGQADPGSLRTILDFLLR